MDRYTWQMPMGARFEFEMLEDEQVVVRYYDHEDQKTIEEISPGLIPGLAFAANTIIKAYVVTAMEQEAEAREGMH